MKTNDPQSLLSCLNKDNGFVDIDLNWKYLQFVNNASKEYTDRMFSTKKAEVEDTIKPRRSRIRTSVLEYYDDDNYLQKVQPQESSWYFLNILNLALSDRF
jgi:hypothetical protein